MCVCPSARALRPVWCATEWTWTARPTAAASLTWKRRPAESSPGWTWTRSPASPSRWAETVALPFPVSLKLMSADGGRKQDRTRPTPTDERSCWPQHLSAGLMFESLATRTGTEHPSYNPIEILLCSSIRYIITSSLTRPACLPFFLSRIPNLNSRKALCKNSLCSQKGFSLKRFPVKLPGRL